MWVILRRHVLATLFQRYGTTKSYWHSMSSITENSNNITSLWGEFGKGRSVNASHTWNGVRSSLETLQTAGRVSCDYWIGELSALRPWRFAACECLLQARTSRLAPFAGKEEPAHELPFGGSKWPLTLVNNSTWSWISLRWCHAASPITLLPTPAAALASPLIQGRNLKNQWAIQFLAKHILSYLHCA